MDEPGIPPVLLWRNLRELDFLNRTLGGHATTLKGIAKLMTDRRKTWSVTDLGCGSGDSLKQIARWARRNGFVVRLTGIDNNPDAIDFMRRHCAEFPEISGMVGDYRDYPGDEGPADIVICSLFCHHLRDRELAVLFHKLRLHTTTGFIINDLQRSRPAYFGAKLFTILAGGSSLARNDGPLSVLKGFTAHELRSMLKEAGIGSYSLSRRWAFRLLVTARH